MRKFLRTLIGINKHISPTADSYLNIPDIGISPLTYGDKVPDFEYFNSKGETCTLKETTSKNAVILVFFRGTWCLNCQLELTQIQKEMEDFEIKKIKVLAVSTDLQKNHINFSQKHDLTYELISDTDNKISKVFDIAIPINNTVPKSVIKTLSKKEGIDLSKSYLSLPATYIIDKKMSILYNFIDYDFTKRVRVSELAGLINQNT